MFIFLLTKLICWGPGHFNSLMDRYKTFPWCSSFLEQKTISQIASQTTFSRQPVRFKDFTDTLRKLQGNHSCWLWKHNSRSRRHYLSHYFNQLMLDLLAITNLSELLKTLLTLQLFSLRSEREHFPWWLSERPVIGANTLAT
jgi:hypothetical protein